MQIKYSLFSFIFCTILPLSIAQETQNKKYIVIIDPAGDSRKIGRQIGDTYERAITLQCAEKIKEYIYLHAPHIQVMITRMPGDSVYDLQNASLANRLKADFFIHLSCYHCKETKPTLFLYQFSYGNDFAPLQEGLALHTYDQAYRINKNETDRLCTLFKEQLSQQKYQSLYAVAGIYSLPIKPLIGITSPCIALDIGIKNKEGYVTYIEPLAQSIISLFE